MLSLFADPDMKGHFHGRAGRHRREFPARLGVEIEGNAGGRQPGILSILRLSWGAPKVKAIRGYSDFGFSYVYIIFEDGTDIY